MESWITLKMWFAFLRIGSVSVVGEADDMVRSVYIVRVERRGRISSQRLLEI